MAKTGKRKGIARIPGYILRGINLLFAAGLLVSLTAQFIPPDRIWIPAFFGISFPFWLISNLVFFILWLFRWRRFALLSLVTLLISFPLTLRFFSWPHKKTGEGIPFVTLITYNVKTMYRVENGKPRSTLKNIETVIKAQGAEIYKG